jgi:hypothetical protein
MIAFPLREGHGLWSLVWLHASGHSLCASLCGRLVTDHGPVLPNGRQGSVGASVKSAVPLDEQAANRS